MYAKSISPSVKREVQKERSAKRDDQIVRPRRAQTCARWECVRQAGRFFFMDRQEMAYISTITPYFYVKKFAELH